MMSLRKTLVLLTLVAVSLADKPAPTFSKTAASATVAKQPTATITKEPVAAAAKTAKTKAVDKAEDRQDTYGAPAQPAYGAPAQDTYGSPQAPAQDSYGSPSAPVQQQYSAPAEPSSVGTQGYYYYYYPVSTAPVQSKPSYAPPRQGHAGGSNPLSSVGVPIVIAIIVGIGIIIGIGILIAVASSTTTTTGRSLINMVTDNLDDITDLAYNAIQMYSQMNSRN